MKQNHLLGLLVWILVTLFPTPEELRSFNISENSDLSLKNLNSISHNKMKSLPQKSSQIYKILYNKLLENLILKKYSLCKKSYEILRCVCVRNVANTDILLKYLLLFTQHLGFGNFVGLFLETCFRENGKMLPKIHNLSFDKMPLKNSGISFPPLYKYIKLNTISFVVSLQFFLLFR